MKCPFCDREEVEELPGVFTRDGNTWDADWTPAGARWWDWVLSSALLAVLWPVAKVVRLFNRKPIYVCKRCGEEQDQAFQCQICGWGDLYEK